MRIVDVTLDPANNEDDKESSYDGGCLLSGLEWRKARDALRCLSPDGSIARGGGEIRCSTARLFQTAIKEKCAVFWSSKERKGTCPVEWVKEESWS